MNEIATHIIVWAITFIACLSFTIFMARGVVEVGVIWLCGLALAIIAAFVGNRIDTGRMWNWFWSALLIAALCSIASSTVCLFGRRVSERVTNAGLYAGFGGISGFNLLTAILLSFLSFSTDIESGMRAFDRTFSFIESYSVWQILAIILVFPATGAVVGLIINKVLLEIERKKREDEEAQQRMETERAEQQRIREQERRAYERWEKNEESEINNLLKNLNGLNSKLSANSNDAQKKAGTLRLMAQHTDKIYLMMLEELEKRNYSGAEVGLNILCTLDPQDRPYRAALDSLANNRQILKDTAIARGLSEQSAYFQSNFA